MKKVPVLYIVRAVYTVATCAVIALHCVPGVHPQEADGGDISVVDNKVCGTIYDPCGYPAENAVVTLRSRDYLPAVGRLGKRRSVSGFFVCSTQTDKKGFFLFGTNDSIPAGVFIMEAHDGNGNGVLIGNCTVDSVPYFSTMDPGLAVEFTDTLKPQRVLKGTVNLGDGGNAAAGVVCIYGLDTYAWIESDGSFVLENAPSEYFRVLITVTGSSGTQSGCLTVSTHAADSAVLNTLYHMAFNGNGNDGMTMPLGDRWIEGGEVFVVPGNEGNFVKTGYRFYGWNTQPDGSGMNCMPGDTFIVKDSSLVLYAQWNEIRRLFLSVSADGHGLVSGSDSVDPGSAFTISATPDKGYRFVAWRMIAGTATIADSVAPITTVTLDNGNAAIAGIFAAITFMKTFDHAQSDYGYSAQPTLDGGYILTGTACYGSESVLTGAWVYLVKTDSGGDTVWTRTLEAVRSSRSTYVEQARDGGFAVTGAVNDSTMSVYVVKIAAGGAIVWERQFGEPYSAIGYSVAQTGDNGFIISGSRRSDSQGVDAYLIRINSNGDSIWTRVFGGEYDQYANSAVPTVDGGFILTGGIDRGSEKGFFDVSDVFLIKTNADGATQWTKTISGDGPESGTCIEQTADGGYIISSSEGDWSLIKTDADGEMEWGRKIDSVGWKSVRQTADGGFILTGSTSYLKSELYLLKTDVYGNTMWMKQIIGNGYGIEGRSVRQTVDGGFVIAGTALYDAGGSNWCDMILIKTDENGDVN